MSRREQLEEMLAAEPDDTFLHYALALELTKGAERPAGLQRLAEMNVRFPDHVPAYFRRGQLLAEDGDSTALVTQIDKIIPPPAHPVDGP